MKSIVARRVHFIVILVGIVLLPLIANAQQPSVIFKSDSTHMLIGDHLKVQMEVRQNARTYLPLDAPEAMLPDNFELLSAGKIDTANTKNDILQLRQELTLTSFDTGVFVIPQGKIYYTNNEAMDSINPQGFTIRISTVAVDTSQAIKDIKAPYEAPLNFAEIWPYLLGFVILLLLGYLIYRFIQQRNKKPEKPVREKPKEPAHIIAFRELDKLKDQNLPEKGEVKLYYTLLTDIARNYLWHRFDVRTLERTSEEILTSVKTLSLVDRDDLNRLEDLFYNSDLVKFAKYKPPVDLHKKLMEETWKFVDDTKRVLEEPVDGRAEQDEINQTNAEEKKKG